VGMGKDAFEASEVAREVFRVADGALGEPLSALCFEGPDEDLRRTANTQPAVLATSIALLRLLDRTPDVCAGHSLGEYAANVCGGSVDLADAIRLVRARGTYMQEAVPEGQGAMAAVMGKDADVVVRACEDTPGTVEA